MLPPMSRNTSVLQPFARQSWEKPACWSLGVPFPWCSTHPDAWLELASLLPALPTAGPGRAGPPAHAQRVSVAFEVVQIETAAISSQFLSTSWKELRSLKWSSSSAPSTFPLTEKPLPAAPAPHSSSTCPAPPAQRREDFWLLSKHNWLLSHVSFDTQKHPFILPTTARNIPERQKVAIA